MDVLKRMRILALFEGVPVETLKLLAVDGRSIRILDRKALRELV